MTNLNPTVALDLADPAIFEALVEQYYQKLFRFAIALSGHPSHAADLTQQTFYILRTKGQQLRDRQKVRAWLHTTLYREFLKARRHDLRFPKINWEDADRDLPPVKPRQMEALDSTAVMAELQNLEEQFRVPLVMFYLEDWSYQEIADTLQVPLGTVMSRLWRGKQQLRARLTSHLNADSAPEPGLSEKTAQSKRPQTARPARPQAPQRAVPTLLTAPFAGAPA